MNPTSEPDFLSQVAFFTIPVAKGKELELDIRASIGEQNKCNALTLPPPFFFYLTSPPLSNQKELVRSQEQKLLLHMATTFEHSFLIYCSSRVSLLYMCLSSTGD